MKIPVILFVLLSLRIAAVGDVWMLTGSPPELSGEPWVTEAASTSLADRQIFDSTITGEPVSYHIYLPPSYDAGSDSYPVLYWLHGSGNGVLGIPWLATYFHSHITAGRIPPMIIVFPNGLPEGMWCDSKDGKTPVESILMQELIPLVDENFRTIADRRGRLLEGFSMGGYGAGRLGFKYPDVFRAFSLIGAGPLQLDLLVDDPNLRPIADRQRIFEKVFGGDMDYFEQQSPWRIAEAAATNLPDDLIVRIVIGEEDFTLPYNQEFHDHLNALQVPHSYHEPAEVGHSPLAVFEALGPLNWTHYSTVFGAAESRR